MTPRGTDGAAAAGWGRWRGGGRIGGCGSDGAVGGSDGDRLIRRRGTIGRRGLVEGGGVIGWRGEVRWHRRIRRNGCIRRRRGVGRGALQTEVNRHRERAVLGARGGEREQGVVVPRGEAGEARSDGEGDRLFAGGLGRAGGGEQPRCARLHREAEAFLPQPLPALVGAAVRIRREGGRGPGAGALEGGLARLPLARLVLGLVAALVTALAATAPDEEQAQKDRVPDQRDAPRRREVPRRCRPRCEPGFQGSSRSRRQWRGLMTVKWRRSSVMTISVLRRSARATTDASVPPSGKSP